VKVGFRHAWLSEDVVVAEWVLAGTYTVSGTDGRQRPLGRAGLSILWFDKDGLVKEEHRYGNRGPAMTHAASATSVKRPKGAAELQTIPAGLEIEHASASADEEAHLRLAEGLYVALAEKNEADSVANLAGDIDYEGQLGRARGQSEARALFATMAHGFSQTKFAVEGGWAAGQYAIVEYELSGIDRVSLLGLAATNRPITLHAADVLEIVDGKIVQVQSYSNPLELMTELGALKDKLILR
jgi:ketosteroid isomerase-like protein